MHINIYLLRLKACIFFKSFSHFPSLLHAEWDDIPIPFMEMCQSENYSEIALVADHPSSNGNISGSIPDFATFKHC